MQIHLYKPFIVVPCIIFQKIPSTYLQWQHHMS